jgi:hypothetical protein
VTKTSFGLGLLKLCFLVATTMISFVACAQQSDFSAPAIAEQPPITQEEQSEILSRYDHLDPQHLVPTSSLATALVYYDKHQSQIRNKNYLAVIDFSKNSSKKRFFILNMQTGVVWNIHVAHGKGSDPDFDGFAQSFSNEDQTHKSSVGFYLTNETYYGEHGLSLRLDGLSSTNSNARNRAIVIHGAEYVQEADVVQGRSWGCPAVAMGNRDTVIRILKDGALIYAVK